MKKIIALILVFCASLLTVVSCNDPAQKEFSFLGFKITLTEDFTEKNVNENTRNFKRENLIVTVSYQSFQDVDDKLTVLEYAEKICEKNNLNSEAAMNGDHADFEYEKTENERVYKYFAKCYKSDFAFWTVQFVCFKDKSADLSSEIKGFADSIKFEK